VHSDFPNALYKRTDGLLTTALRKRRTRNEQSSPIANTFFLVWTEIENDSNSVLSITVVSQNLHRHYHHNHHLINKDHNDVLRDVAASLDGQTGSRPGCLHQT
jgi:hypothetical protein